MDLELRGRRVLITGASKGIGQACAEVFAAEGCSLDLVSRSAPALEGVAADLRNRFGVDAVARPADLSLPDSQVALADSLETLDIVVNNAGAIPGGDLSAERATSRAAWATPRSWR